jgi:hypothetical protein
MGLLKFLFITICVLWLIRMVIRLALPYIFQNLVKKAQQRAYQYQRPPQQNRTDGRITVDYVPPKERNGADKAGDFVEYEEIR